MRSQACLRYIVLAALAACSVHGCDQASDTCDELTLFQTHRSQSLTTHNVSAPQSKTVSRRSNHSRVGQDAEPVSKPVLVSRGAKERARGKPRPPGGADIWNETKPWATVQIWHPTGVISHTNNGAVTWSKSAFINLNTMAVISVVAYPFLQILLFTFMTVVLSMMLSESEERGQNSSRAWTSLPDTEGPGGNLLAHISSSTSPSVEVFTGSYTPPVLSPSSLTPRSQSIYSCWVLTCRALPCMMVFGTPVLLICLAIPFPQEIFGTLSLITACILFGNGLYMSTYGGIALLRLFRLLEHDAAPDATAKCSDRPADNFGVKHWVLMPMYSESEETLQGSLSSTSASVIAKTSISIVLAMEAREEGAQDKADRLKAHFEGEFAEIIITMHPANLPNDPPGKASNLKWAHECLLKHLSQQSVELSGILLTVSDADSEFQANHFENLTDRYLEEEPTYRNLRIWQAPVLHLKNYHRQPLPVVVGTMFTTMTELSTTGDPFVLRFPYSTYSLSLELAIRVGGWDANWIAEDWHMGIKCFLLTLGRATVKPLWTPIMNYTPEDATWWTTILARWAQAKRHALGFSDISYYFMTLPLIFAFAHSARGKSGQAIHLTSVWWMTLQGLTLVVRIVNVHVLLGVIPIFNIFIFILKFTMMAFVNPDLHIDNLWTKTAFCTGTLMGSTIIFMLMVSTFFMCTYRFAKNRVEPPRPIEDSVRFRYILIHWAVAACSFIFIGLFYFIGLGFAVWRAAWMTLTSPVFEYEVALKPNLSSRREDEATASSSGDIPAVRALCK